MGMDPSKLLKGAVAVALASIIVFSASVVGSPWERRKQIQDQEIRYGIALIAEKLNEHRGSHPTIPASLEELGCKSSSAWHKRKTHLGQAGCATREISYERLSSESAKICATFHRPGPSDLNKDTTALGYYGYQSDEVTKTLAPLAAHPAGRFCFTLEVEPKPEKK
ncbi:MAG: hypothetical protein IPI58_07085 [Alphaproteobacteria bacterium]|nr:MAG: hypothetical protein IPI58_07085 [Alphaproteobacteria bacterium]